MDPVKPSSANVIMEKLQLKYLQKPWNETMKLVRLCMDKSHQSTSTETTDSPISICLERIQRALNESLSTVMNRLEFLSNRKGLNYHISPSGAVCYITSKSFYIEIYLEMDGKVTDVKLAQPGRSPETCEDLLQLLRLKDYDTFERTLEDLLSIYQIPGSSMMRARVFAALQSLEKDLCLLSALHKTPDMDRVTEILCGKIGYLTPSSEGIPLSLEFYLSQYQILEEQLSQGLQIPGRKVFVIMRSTDTSHKLPLTPLIVDSSTGEVGCIYGALERECALPFSAMVSMQAPLHPKELFFLSREADVSASVFLHDTLFYLEACNNPIFLPLMEVIFTTLSACFFLTFPQPFPMSSSSIHELEKLTGIPIDGLKPAPLHELIVQFALTEMHRDDLMASSSSFIVCLPDCPKHSYFLGKGTEKSGLTGAMVTEIPFAHPKCVSHMIEVLRHQAAYNTLIASCVSEKTECDDPSDLLYFEVSQQQATCFSVTFQHPFKEGLICVMINVLSSMEILCTLFPVSEEGPLNCSNDYLTRVMKRCMSVPVLMRAIFKKATKQKADEVLQTIDGTVEESSRDVQAETNQE